MRAVLITGAVACLAVGGAAAALSDGQGSDDARSAFAAAREQVLRERLTLPVSDSLQLVLDPERGRLALSRGAATLREWPVTAVAAGRRRLGFGRDTRRADWRTRVWRGGVLDPPVHVQRRVIVSNEVTPPDLSGAVDWIPPTPEEAVPTPARFIVHYADGLGLEVVAVGAGDGVGLRTITGRLLLAVRGLVPPRWDRYRVRVRMSAAEAGALYRAFPTGAVFMAVLPGGERSPAPERTPVARSHR
jgi:hypothetical protein